MPYREGRKGEGVESKRAPVQLVELLLAAAEEKHHHKREPARDQTGAEENPAQPRAPEG